MSIEALNCHSCGAVLKVSGSICECEYCGSTNIICGETGKFINLLNRANSLRQQCEFDRAFNVYDEILAQNPPTADVLWAQTLCEYGIEYVQDPASNKYLPTMHRIKEERILGSKTYLEALDLADADQKEKLTEEANEIQRIQDEYLNIASNEKPYDVFICYKETDDETHKQTEDSGLALDLYERLENYGFKVFFSRVTLQDKIGVNYEPYIFAALKSSTVMVVIGTKQEYFEATWVKNEWSRFQKLRENDKTKQLFFACDNIEDLPKAFSQRQAQLLTEPNSIQNLAYNIKKCINITREDSASKIQPVPARSLTVNETKPDPKHEKPAGCILSALTIGDEVKLMLFEDRIESESYVNGKKVLVPISKIKSLKLQGTFLSLKYEGGNWFGVGYNLQDLNIAREFYAKINELRESK